MREILFRGKRITDGEWIEGGYFLEPYPNKAFMTRGNGFGIGFVEHIEVEPSTVGQYTGLKDKNGVRIFDGDVLQVTELGGTTAHCAVGYGAYKPFTNSTKYVGFYLYWGKDKWQEQKYANIAFWIEEREAICVGNIYDNPELIGVRG